MFAARADRKAHGRRAAGNETKGGTAMKTLQGFYDLVVGDDDQKRAFVEAMETGKAVDFLHERGCDVTAEELKEFLASKKTGSESIELSDDELKEIAGGSAYSDTCACGHKTHNCSDACIRYCC